MSKVSASRMRDATDTIFEGPLSVRSIADSMGINYHTLYQAVRVRGAEPELIRAFATEVEHSARQAIEAARELRRAARGLPPQ
jgi:hypothetical protein